MSVAAPDLAIKQESMNFREPSFEIRDPEGKRSCQLECKPMHVPISVEVQIRTPEIAMTSIGRSSKVVLANLPSKIDINASNVFDVPRFETQVIQLPQGFNSRAKHVPIAPFPFQNDDLEFIVVNRKRAYSSSFSDTIIPDDFHIAQNARVFPESPITGNETAKSIEKESPRHQDAAQNSSEIT